MCTQYIHCNELTDQSDFAVYFYKSFMYYNIVVVYFSQ